MHSIVTRRMYRRVEADYPACYLTSHSGRFAAVRDIALNGFRVRCLSAPPAHTILKLQLWLPGQKDEIKIDQAVVCWAEQDEFGVQIVSLSSEADCRLAVHIAQLLHRQPLGGATEEVLLRGEQVPDRLCLAND
ncbi:MAG TPA: PilZ domain-containing protein [Nitrospira sp.]|nr:PilZ domain-containing protein [Nitrospira sp.]